MRLKIVLRYSLAHMLLTLLLVGLAVALKSRPFTKSLYWSPFCFPMQQVRVWLIWPYAAEHFRIELHYWVAVCTLYLVNSAMWGVVLAAAHSYGRRWLVPSDQDE